MKESVRLKLLKRNPVFKKRTFKLQSKKQEGKKKSKRSLNTRHVKRGSYEEQLKQAGIVMPVSLYIVLVLIGATIVAVVMANSIGLLVGLMFGPCFAYFFFTMFLLARAQKRRREAIPHLPAFVDTLSASLSTGYTMEDAFKHAAISLPNGVLKKEMQRTVNMLDKNFPISEGLDILLSRLTGREVVSLVVTIKLFSDMGGRVLTPFQRLGYKIRDQQAIMERAGRDLVGVKQAFYVIFALSMMVPMSLMVTDPDYLMSALNHPTLKWLVQGAVVVQGACFMFFKHFTSIKV